MYIRAIAIVLSVFLFSFSSAKACDQTNIVAGIKHLVQIGDVAQKNLEYLIPMFQKCGQSAIASKLAYTPDWLAAMKQSLTGNNLQVQNRAILKKNIQTAMARLGEAESQLREYYEFTLQGISSMYDERFPAECKSNYSNVKKSMITVRPMVPQAIQMLQRLQACIQI